MIVLGVKEIKVISLDVTGTLVSRRFVDFFWLELVPRLFAERHGVSIDEAKRIVYLSYDKIGKDDIRWYVPNYWFELFDLKMRVSEALRLIRSEVEVYNDVKEALRRLSAKYDVVISSNLSREFIDVALDVIGFQGFRAIFSCVSDLGLVSKTSGFYRFVAERLKVDPKEVLHVGDDYERDYENPIKAGMNAVLVKRDNNVTYPHVRNLMELLKLLNLIS
ncbi:MAG: HAD family hydrolase [Candidatus Nezhaarchaeota archaeon]|nr:HAD family hydrolase [Candidatus Nezhaarchaeota archaeon]